MKTAAPEKKSVKTLKGQLFGAVSMMLVAAIALGTSTYAWFINNRTVEVENMQLNVSTSTSLLVAVEKQAAANTWTGLKNVVINDDIIGIGAEQAGWTKFLENEMVPASITTANLSATPVKFYAATNHVSGGKLDEFTLVPSDRGDTGVGQGPVKHLGLKFVASNKMDVYFGATDLTTSLADLVSAVTSHEAEAVEIQKALRVALVPAGSAPIVLQFDAGTAGTNGNNTDYNGKLNTATQNETIGKYDAIGDIIADPGKVNATGTLSVLVPADATKKYMATVDAAGEVTAPAAPDGSALFTVPAGDTGLVVDVYIWLEGTDNDCLNALSGYTYNLRLPFAGVINTTP